MEDDKARNAISDFLSTVFLLLCSLGCQVLALIEGWGLQPKSWWWIIGVGFFANLTIRALADKVTKK